MKISNETKVGALTTLAITLLILGFNFLKGKSLFKTGSFIYAKVVETKGIMVSNPVYVNGYQIGAVYEIEAQTKSLDTMIIAIKLNQELNIPANSIAAIVSNPLGSPKIDIAKGDSRTFLKNHDTISTMASPSMFEGMAGQLTPVVDQVKVTLHSLDTVLNNVNSIMDPYTKNNLQDVIANFNRISSSLLVSTVANQNMLDKQNGALAKSLENVNRFTGNLANNNEKINGMLTNFESTSSNLAKADINGTVNSLRQTVERLNATVEKLDSKDGTMGKLLNDTQMYDNLAATTRSLNILMDDIRVNPKRYVSISVFGGKSKSQYLTSPLPVKDSAVNK